MPLVQLSNGDLARLAQAARAMAVMHDKDAEKNARSSMRPHFEEQARRYRELAAYLEGTREISRGQ